MRVALLTEIISPYRIPVFNHLAKLPGIDLTVLFSSETEAHRKWENLKDGIEFKYEVLPGMALHRTKHLSLFFNPGIISTLRRGKYDTIICGGYHQPPNWFALVYAKINRKRILLWSESNRQDERTRNFAKDVFKKLIIPAFDAYIVPGTPQSEYLNDFSIPTSNIWVAPNAVDVEFFMTASERYRAEKEQIKQKLGISGTVVLYVGRLIDSKGVEDLLSAFETISQNRDVVLVLVGNGPDEERYQMIAHERNIRACFVGFQQQTDLPMYYAIADLFVFPTHSDPWGLVLNEALSCGLPVVVSAAAGAAADLVKPDWNGYRYALGDMEALTKSMEELLDAPLKRQAMGMHSQQLVLEFTPEKCAMGIANAIQNRRAVN